MSNRNDDQWGFGDALPWILIIGGLIAIPMFWPLGAAALAIGVAMATRASR